MLGKKTARFINPPNILKQKVGGGGIPLENIMKAQKKIDQNPHDLLPFARQCLKELDKIYKDYSEGNLSGDEFIDKMANPIMQLKGNGGMFGYELISRIADVVLFFLDNIEELNDDVLEIVDAHHNSLKVIITEQLKGTGGPEGKALEDELKNACQRYYKKYDISPE
jgi:hypothetical protein